MNSACLRTAVILWICCVLSVEAARVRIPGGAIAGIVVGSIFGISLLVLYIVYMVFKIGLDCAVCLAACPSGDKGQAVQPAPDQTPENQEDIQESIP